MVLSFLTEISNLKLTSFCKMILSPRILKGNLNLAIAYPNPPVNSEERVSESWKSNKLKPNVLDFLNSKLVCKLFFESAGQRVAYFVFRKELGGC